MPHAHFVGEGDRSFPDSLSTPVGETVERGRRLEKDMATILAVCEDDAFATMLIEGLEGLGGHRVVLSRTGDDAKSIAARQRPDLLIVDVDLRETSPAELVHAVRSDCPETRLIWMPFIGQPLAHELSAIDAQGILTKPFFIDELPHHIETALSGGAGPGPDFPFLHAPAEPDESTIADVTADAGGIETPVIDEPPPVAVEPGPDASQPRPSPSPDDRIQRCERRVVLGAERAPQTRLGKTPARSRSGRVPPSTEGGELGDSQLCARLQKLAEALNAEAAVLTDRQGRLLAWAGLGGQKRAIELVHLLATAVAADQLADFLGEQGGRLHSSTHEGECFTVFTLFLAPRDLVLSVAVSAETPLGNVRYQVRQAAAEMFPRSRYGPR